VFLLKSVMALALILLRLLFLKVFIKTVPCVFCSMDKWRCTAHGYTGHLKEVPLWI